LASKPQEDAVVQGAPVVVELVARVGEAFAALPPDGAEVGGGERLGHEDVVVDGEDEGAQSLEHARVGVGPDDHPAGRDGTGGGRHPDSGAVHVERGRRAALVDRAAERLDRRRQPPYEAGRVDEGH